MTKSSGSNFYADEGTAAHRIFERCMRNAKLASDKFVGKVIDTSCERTHAPFAPSSSKRWLSCTASVKHLELAGMNAGVTQQGSKITVTNEMAEAVQVAVDYARQFIDKDCKVYVEHEVYISATKDKGHVDLGIYDKKTQWLHVFDYKHGAGILVGAKRNTQMMMYALGLLAEVRNESNYIDGVLGITLHIMQPRCERRESPFDTWDLTLAMLQEFGQLVKRQVAEAKSAAPKYVVSDECRYCASATCPEFAKKALSVAQAEFDQFMDKPPKGKPTMRVINDRELAHIMNNLGYLKAFCEAVPAEVQRRIEAGKKVKGWGMGPGRAQRQWKNEDLAFAAMRKMGIDIDELLPRTYIAMTAAEKLLPKTKRAAFMAKHTVIKTGKPTLLPEHKINSAEKDFEDLL